MGMSSTQKDPAGTDPRVLLSCSSPSLPLGPGTTLRQGWNSEEDAVAILTPVLCVCRETEAAELPGEVPLSPQVLQLGAWGLDEVSVLQGLMLLGLGLRGSPRAQSASAAEAVPPLKASSNWVDTVP